MTSPNITHAEQQPAIIPGQTPLSNQQEAFFVPVSMAAGGFDKRYSVNLLGLMNHWRRYWYAILATAVIMMLLSVWYVGTRVPIYEAKLAIAESSVPVTSLTQQQQGGVSLGALLSGAPENSSLARFRSTFFSVRMATILRDKYNLFDDLYRGEWNAETESWQEIKRFNVGLSLKRLFGLNTYQAPSPQRLKEYLVGSIMVVPMPEDGTVLYQYRHADPAFAQRILGIMFVETNELIRQKDLEDYGQLLGSLKEQIRATSDVSQREALYQLTAQYQYKIALANLEDVPYAAEKIDLVSPSIPVAPSPLKVLVAAFLFGIFASVGVLTLGYFVRKTPVV